ncbi:sensor domain-containing diguanylate cyclase [Lacimicrobium alkaliphilum]|uniref:Diguanylate cyclase n=1 Tax=Lacimicrobium alkaliphilum TaxID=1526571 RepID=A0A0U2ZK60_9ALTE|nr:GGDEF domain-containing protein [Lacimicrobium alkaliphilum]ALS98716.1 hypothetical protein AT746_10830 [Lacimicrobium alkaliphilum]
MNRSGLVVRIALGVGGTAVSVTLLCTFLFYQLTVKQEIKVSTQQAESLFITVKETAASAAYLGEQGTDLAQELVDGLTNNEMVASAHMQFSGLRVSSGTDGTTSATPEIYNIYSIFQPDEKLGELHLYLDQEYIQSRAEDIARGSALAMLFLAFLVTLFVMVAAYYLVTRPLSRIAKTLHNIEPGTEGRLPKADFHQQSELGSLVEDINQLLSKAEHQLKSERQLRAQIEALEKKFRLMFQNSISPIVLADIKGNVMLHNLAFERLLDSLGVTDSTQHGPLLCDLFAAPTAMLNTIVPALKTNNVALGEFKLRTPPDKPGCWVQMVVSNFKSDDASEYQQITLHDISSQHEELKALSRKAQYDPLTELLNRHGLENKLDEKVSKGEPFTLVLFDLNWFKQVNDRYGHSAGDSILRYIAEGIRNTLSQTDTGGRWGGDEFVLIIDGTDRQRVMELCQQLLDFISQPYPLEEFETEVRVGASMGAAMFPHHKSDIKELIALADKAMYVAKGVKSRDKNDEFLIFADDEDPSIT